MKKGLLRVLLVDDDFYFRDRIKNILKRYCEVVDTGSDLVAGNLIQSNFFDVVIIDLNLNQKKIGLELLKLAKNRKFYSVILTDHDEEKYVQEAYESGCDHYLTKEQCEKVISFILKGRLSQINGQGLDKFIQEEFITQDEKLINDLKALQGRLYQDTPILILGETGVGKGKIAEVIHQLIHEDAKEMISTNVSAIPSNLIESEFFGHIKGAFTGANEHKKGLFALANEGTLFLDEIATMSMLMQKKLLKALEEKSFYPLGSSHPVKTKFHLITATSEDIGKKIEENKFRIDLFQRLKGIILRIPPLRERKGDIPLLIQHYMAKGSRKVFIKEEAMKKLMNYSWPGNIRELKFVVEELCNHKGGIIDVDNLPICLSNDSKAEHPRENQIFIPEEHVRFLREYGFDAYIGKVERESVQKIHDLCGGAKGRAQEILRLTRSSYYRILKRLTIS